MRLLKVLPVLALSALMLVACGKKDAASTGSNVTVNPIAPIPIVPTDFNTQCQMRGGQVSGSLCIVPVSGYYQASNAFTYSINYYFSIGSGYGVVTSGSGSVRVYVGGTEVGLNARRGDVSGTLKITTSGTHNYQVWMVQCQNASFQTVACPASF